VRRRDFITGVATAAALPLAARAQRSGGRPRLGVLMGAAENLPDSQTRIAAFRQGLAEHGWKDGENIQLDVRWASGEAEIIRRYASELVALAPDVILANGTAVLAAVKDATTSIPVVFSLAVDPVGLGHVQSLARPGGNITGFTFLNPELIGKWAGLLATVAPTLKRAGVLFNFATSPFYVNFMREAQAGLPPGTIELTSSQAGTPAEIDAAIDGLAQQPGSGLIIGPGPLNQIQIKSIATLAARHRLPSISVYRPFAVEGGLMSYGPDTADVFRRSAGYVDRILKGAKPADLPVQQPVKFEFVINHKTAKALGFEMPQTLLATADEVIE
jgi:putative tryptophan/tyrosine transport system substrate-binding protein